MGLLTEERRQEDEALQTAILSIIDLSRPGGGAAPSVGSLSRRVGDRRKAVVMSPKQYRDALRDPFGRERLDVHGAIHDP
jgi:hypothetical protein